MHPSPIRRALLAVCLSIPAGASAQCLPPVQALVADRKLDAARADVQAQLKRHANDDALLECLGRVLVEQGASADAVEALETAVKLNALSATHQMWLGHALRDEVQKAGVFRQPFLARRMKAAYEQALALDSSLVDAHHSLLVYLSHVPSAFGGSMPAAREHANAILKLDPVRGHSDLGLIAEQDRDIATAEKELLAAIAAGPDTPLGYNAAGQFYLRQQRWTDAISVYERLLKARPDAVNAHLTIGRVLVSTLKDYDRGDRELRFWIANHPKDAPGINVSVAHYWLGVVHQQRGRREDARAAFQAALAANPENGEAKKALASLR